MQGDEPNGSGDENFDGNGEDRSEEETSDKIDIGAALRTVYDDAAGEDVPREMLDLLGKLD